MEIINLTPHEIIFYNEDGESYYSVAPESAPARVRSQTEDAGEMSVTTPRGEKCTIPVTKSTFGEITGLPDPKPGSIYVVSSLVAQACRGVRGDLYVPNESVRDEFGRIVGCRSLGRI